MRLLSVTAASRLAERLVHQAGGQLDRDYLLVQLEGHDVDRERAAAGVRMAVSIGRLEVVDGDEGPDLRARAVVTPSTPKEPQQR